MFVLLCFECSFVRVVFLRLLFNNEPTNCGNKLSTNNIFPQELINLSNDFSDGVVSEWIGNYLDDHPDIPSKDLFEKLTAQYGEFVNSTDASRALMKIEFKKEEYLAELASRMSNLARLAYRDSELREGSTVQVQLAEFFIDGVTNSFIKEDGARANPTT